MDNTLADKGSKALNLSANENHISFNSIDKSLSQAELVSVAGGKRFPVNEAKISSTRTIIYSAGTAALCSLFAASIESWWMWDTQHGLDHIMMWKLTHPDESFLVSGSLFFIELQTIITFIVFVFFKRSSWLIRRPVFLIFLLIWTRLDIVANSWATKSASIQTGLALIHQTG